MRHIWIHTSRISPIKASILLYSAGNFDLLIALSEKYKFKIIFQIDGRYLYNPTLEEARAKAACAIPIINKYKDHPNVLAFSVREEPSIGLMDALMEYYRTVRASSDAPFHLLLNWSETVKYKFDQSVMPIVMGTDRYDFGDGNERRRLCVNSRVCAQNVQSRNGFFPRSFRCIGLTVSGCFYN